MNPAPAPVPFLDHGEKLFWQLAAQSRLVQIAREFGHCHAFLRDAGLIQIPSFTAGQDGTGVGVSVKSQGESGRKGNMRCART